MSTIEMTKDSAIAKNNEGVDFHNQGKYADAIKCYDEAIQIDPGYFLAYDNRAAAYIELKNHEQALADNNKAIEVKPDEPRAYNYRGLTWAKLNKYEEAIADFESALKLDPNFQLAKGNLAHMYNTLGSDHLKQGNKKQAVETFEKALAIDPNNATAQENLAKLKPLPIKQTLITGFLVGVVYAFIGYIIIKNNTARIVAFAIIIFPFINSLKGIKSWLLGLLSCSAGIMATAVVAALVIQMLR